MSAADYLAHEIGWAHAREVARVMNSLRGRGTRRITTAEVFDPHAATELAALIEHRMRPPSRAGSGS